MNEKGIYIGTIDFGDDVFVEDALREYAPLSKSCIVKVNSTEGENVPHFHVSPKSGAAHDYCVRIFYPKLFDHNDFHSAQFKNKDKKKLNDFLKRKHDDYGTNWEAIKHFWFKLYPDSAKMCKNLIQPDYSKMIQKPIEGSKIGITYDQRKDIYAYGDNVYILAKATKIKNLISDEKSAESDQLVLLSGFTREPVSVIYDSIITKTELVKTKDNKTREIWISHKGDKRINEKHIDDIYKKHGLEYIKLNEKWR